MKRNQRHLIESKAEGAALEITNAENVNRLSKTESKHASVMGKSYTLTPDIVEAGRESRDGMPYQSDEKPKHAEFPLDVILPVFNLSKQERSFIPTLKIRSKDEPAPKEKFNGVIKGSNFHSHAP